MKAIHAVGVCLLACAESACCTLRTSTPPVTPMSTVINQVKDELNYLKGNIPTLDMPAPAGSLCKNLDGRNTVKITPTVAKLTLKTVKTKENDPSLGLVNPIGVLSINPAYSGAYSKSQSQNVELDLGFPPDPPGGKAPNTPSSGTDADHPIATTVIAAAKELLNVDHSKTPCVIPQSLNVLITFDVVNKSTGGTTINLWVFQLGDKISTTNETHQNLEVDFDLSGSSPMGPDGKVNR